VCTGGDHPSDPMITSSYDAINYGAFCLSSPHDYMCGVCYNTIAIAIDNFISEAQAMYVRQQGPWPVL